MCNVKRQKLVIMLFTKTVSEAKGRKICDKVTE